MLALPPADLLVFKEKIQASLQKFQKVVYILYLYFPNGLYWLCLQLISKCSKRKSRPAFKIGNPAGVRSSSSQWGSSSEAAMYYLVPKSERVFHQRSCTYDAGHFDDNDHEHDYDDDDDDEDNGNCHQSVRVFPQRLLH